MRITAAWRSMDAPKRAALAAPALPTTAQLARSLCCLVFRQAAAVEVHGGCGPSMGSCNGRFRRSRTGSLACKTRWFSEVTKSRSREYSNALPRRFLASPAASTNGIVNGSSTSATSSTPPNAVPLSAARQLVARFFPFLLTLPGVTARVGVSGERPRTDASSPPPSSPSPSSSSSSSSSNSSTSSLGQSGSGDTRLVGGWAAGCLRARRRLPASPGEACSARPMSVHLDPNHRGRLVSAASLAVSPGTSNELAREMSSLSMFPSVVSSMILRPLRLSLSASGKPLITNCHDEYATAAIQNSIDHWGSETRKIGAQ
mmetsp:Transcript_832/g.1751  ORF Transcript_832/g.1751 Transcript_832/m.1751 type:complete len:316 (+) Transcript_832:945-1892(+)